MCVGKTIYDLPLGGFVPHGLPPTKVDTRVSRVRKDGLDIYTHRYINIYIHICVKEETNYDLSHGKVVPPPCRLRRRLVGARGVPP